MFVLSNLIKCLVIAVPLILAVAYFTLAERKIMGGIHRRRGPDVVGAWGLLQPFADAFKLVLKETIIPSNANSVIFVIAPILTFFLSVVGWAVIPFGHGMVFSDLNVGVLYLFAILFLVGLWDHHVRMVIQLEVCLPRRSTICSPDGLV